LKRCPTTLEPPNKFKTHKIIKGQDRLVTLSGTRRGVSPVCNQ
jgi:hypothetical protein